MAQYKITDIDEAKGHISFQVISGGSVIMTDTRQDLPIDNKEEVDKILSDFAAAVEADYQKQESADVDPELTKIVNKAQNAKTVEV